MLIRSVLHTAGYNKLHGSLARNTAELPKPSFRPTPRLRRSNIITRFRDDAETPAEILLKPDDFAVYEADFDGKITHVEWKQAAIAWAQAWVPASALIGLMITAQLKSVQRMDAEAAAQALRRHQASHHGHLHGAEKYKHMAYSSWKKARIKLGLRQPDPIVTELPQQSPYRMLMWQVAALAVASALTVIAATIATIVNLPRNVKIASINKLADMDGIIGTAVHHCVNIVYQLSMSLLIAVMHVRADVYGSLHIVVSMIANTIWQFSTKLHRVSKHLAARRHVSDNLAEGMLRLEQFRRSLLDSSDDLSIPVRRPGKARRISGSTLLAPQLLLPVTSTSTNDGVADVKPVDAQPTPVIQPTPVDVAGINSNGKASSNGAAKTADNTTPSLQFDIRYADLQDEATKNMSLPAGLLVRISHPPSGKALPAPTRHIPVPSLTTRLRGGGDGPDVHPDDHGSSTMDGDGSRSAAGNAAASAQAVGATSLSSGSFDETEHLDLVGLADQVSRAAKDYASTHAVPIKELLVEVDFQD